MHVLAGFLPVVQGRAVMRDVLRLELVPVPQDGITGRRRWSRPSGSTRPCSASIRPDPSPQLAFADADLGRLSWGWNAAFGEDKNTRYKAALKAFIRTYADFDISALAIEREARVLQQEGDLVAARKLALRGAELFPQSPGGKLCRNLVNEIEAKSASITTERVWNSK